MPNEFIPCGGCGAESPNDRCIGCMHNFGEQTELDKHAQQVTEQWSAVISTLGMKTVEQVAEENHRLRELAREWCEAFETSNVKAVPDLIHRTKELGL